MSYEYSEDGLVEAAAQEVLEELGWTVEYAWHQESFGPDGLLGRENQSEVILKRYLLAALKKLNPDFPDIAYQHAIQQIEEKAADKTLAVLNKEKHQMLTNGVQVSFTNDKGEFEKKKLRVFDFDNPEENHFLAVRQLEVLGELYQRRPDIVGFVNGIPLVFFELKAHHTDLRNAYTDNLTDYKDTIPHVLYSNAIIILSNGADAKVGTLTSPYKFFHDWKRIEEHEEGIVSLDTMLRGTCAKHRLMDLFENFILFDDSAGLIDFLEYHGFKTLIHLDIKIPARIQNNIVLKVDCADIKHFVLNWVEHADHLENATAFSLREKLLAGSNVYFGKGNISSLRPVKFNPLKSTKETAYFPYQNGIVKATAEKREIMPYEECKFHVWKSQIIDRDFTLDGQFEVDFNFYEFLKNITGKKDDRLKSLLNYMGFILHPYRDPAKPQLLVFYDQKLSDNPEGGTGKGIVSQAIGQIKSMVSVDGKNFNFDSQHCWQRVGMDTQLVVFQDTTKRLKFERLHSVITDGMSVNPKHSPEFFIPFSDSPKFIINTNYIIDAAGATNERRMKEVEFEPHYSAALTPEDEFGELFFHSWDSESWLKFDNLMMSCVQSFLKKGFIDPRNKSKNKSLRLFLQKYGEDTLEWIENLEEGKELRKLESFKEYKDEVGETMRYKITSRMFYESLKTVSDASDIITEVKFGKNKKGSWFELVKKEGDPGDGR